MSSYRSGGVSCEQDDGSRGGQAHRLLALLESNRDGWMDEEGIEMRVNGV